MSLLHFCEGGLPVKPPVINANDALGGTMKVEIKVVGVRRVRFRIWCAKVLIRLACWIINFDIDVKEV